MKGKALLAISVLSACVLGAISPAAEAETAAEEA